MDKLDRDIINSLQGGFPVTERPFAEVAARFDATEDDVIARIRRMLDEGMLTRFGPMYHAERMGGGLTLAAMAVPRADYDRVAALLDAMPEVAHNYEREHELNMWFVLATETPAGIDDAIARIESATELKVYNMPKEREFFVGLRFDV